MSLNNADRVRDCSEETGANTRVNGPGRALRTLSRCAALSAALLMAEAGCSKNTPEPATAETSATYYDPAPVTPGATDAGTTQPEVVEQPFELRMWGTEGLVDLTPGQTVTVKEGSRVVFYPYPELSVLELPENSVFEVKTVNGSKVLSLKQNVPTGSYPFAITLSENRKFELTVVVEK